MSGGSFNYICYTLQNECNGMMCDIEMNDLISDLCNVLHDLEWWQSGDIGEEKYRETVKNFKDKWFKQERKTRLKTYIDKEINKCKKELHELIGD